MPYSKVTLGFLLAMLAALSTTIEAASIASEPSSPSKLHGKFGHRLRGSSGHRLRGSSPTFEMVRHTHPENETTHDESTSHSHKDPETGLPTPTSTMTKTERRTLNYRALNTHPGNQLDASLRKLNGTHKGFKHKNSDSSKSRTVHSPPSPPVHPPDTIDNHPYIHPPGTTRDDGSGSKTDGNTDEVKIIGWATVNKNDKNSPHIKVEGPEKAEIPSKVPPVSEGVHVVDWTPVHKDTPEESIVNEDVHIGEWTSLYGDSEGPRIVIEGPNIVDGQTPDKGHGTTEDIHVVDWAPIEGLEKKEESPNEDSQATESVHVIDWNPISEDSSTNNEIHIVKWTPIKEDMHDEVSGLDTTGDIPNKDERIVDWASIKVEDTDDESPETMNAATIKKSFATGANIVGWTSIHQDTNDENLEMVEVAGTKIVDWTSINEDKNVNTSVQAKEKRNWISLPTEIEFEKTYVSPSSEGLPPKPVSWVSKGDQNNEITAQACPGDVKLHKQTGGRSVLRTDPILDAVQITHQGTSTVTVQLYQVWTNHNHEAISPSIDAFYTNFHRPSHTSTGWGHTHCNEFVDVPFSFSEPVESLEISCNVSSPYAELQICLVDDANHHTLMPRDTASPAAIPRMCHHEASEFSDTAVSVCYTLEIRCSPHGPDEPCSQTHRR